METPTPFQPLAYDDPTSLSDMYGDCEAVRAHLHIPRPRTTSVAATEVLGRPAPRRIEVDEATARLAASFLD